LGGVVALAGLEILVGMVPLERFGKLEKINPQLWPE